MPCHAHTPLHQSATICSRCLPNGRQYAKAASPAHAKRVRICINMQQHRNCPTRPRSRGETSDKTLIFQGFSPTAGLSRPTAARHQLLCADQTDRAPRYPNHGRPRTLKFETHTALTSPMSSAADRRLAPFQHRCDREKERRAATRHGRVCHGVGAASVPASEACVEGVRGP